MHVTSQAAARPPGQQEQGSAGGEGSRHRRRRWVLAAGGAAAAAAVLAAGLIAARHQAPAVPSPSSALTSALARTSARSYTFSLHTTVRSQQKELNSDLVSGAYDPTRGLGAERLSAHAAGGVKQAQSRFIGASVYTSVSPASGFGRPWDKSPLAAAMATGLPLGNPYGYVSDHPLSPAGLDGVLRSPGTVVHDSGPVSGPGWTGTRYTFTARLTAGRESVSGAVAVDRQGRVRLVTTTAEERDQPGGKPIITTVRDLTFGGFGAPVRVTPPPASQVEATSGKPYWGFYF